MDTEDLSDHLERVHDLDGSQAEGTILTCMFNLHSSLAQSRKSIFFAISTSEW